MWRSNILHCIILVLCFTSCKGQDATFDFSQPQLLITSNGDKASAEAADYLFQHLSKRRKDVGDQFLRSDRADDKFSGGKFYVEIVPDLKHDYEIRNELHQLSIFGKNKETMKWLSYMLINHMGEFRRLEVSDLPPNYVDFGGSKETFAMKYREPHLLPNLDEEQSGILYTHSIDRDWGLWGHNMLSVFPNGVDEHSRALVDGKRNNTQFCFSSESTFRAVKDFVVDQYGTDGRIWFMIAPQDNDLACTCASCKKHGNTAQNASGAVAYLVNRLAHEFPGHYFFTMAYRTTLNTPETKMRENTGVFVSTIDLPKTPILDLEKAKVRAFSSLVNRWKEKSDHVYLWDYISNFDDYMTPFPMLKRVQSQISFFSKLQIEGMFLNGSGYDYSPFDDVKTYVLSALMINPLLSVDELVKKYHHRFYPLSGSLLSSYLLDLEETAFSTNLDVGIYTSFLSASQQYHNKHKFLQFYSKLTLLQPKLKGLEKEKVGKLLTALSYTYLQALYFRGDSDDLFLDKQDGENRRSTVIGGALKKLGEYHNYEHLSKYKEEDGLLASYYTEWKHMMKRTSTSNRISAIKVIGLQSGEVLDNSQLLVDNVLGFTSDFNQGWFLSGEDIQCEFTTTNLSGPTKKIVLRFLLNARHRMRIPHGVEIFKNNVKVGSFLSKDFLVTENAATLECSLEINKNEKLQIRVYKNTNNINSVIACDEIQLL